MKLHGHPLSGNSHRVAALLNILGVDYEDIIVNLPGGAHKQPDFLALNPLGQVPVLEDGDVVLRDSTAILTYLARKFDASNTWLPQGAVAEARVQEWLSVSVHEIMQGPFVVRGTKLLGLPGDAEAAKVRTDALFNTLFEPHLAKNDWLVGDHATIADLACYGYIARVTDGDYTLEPYPAIRAWLARVEALDGFAPMVVGADFFAAMQG